MNVNGLDVEARYRQALLDQKAVSTITLADGQLVDVKHIYVNRTLLHEVVQKKPDREITVKLPVALWPKLRDERVVLVEGPAGMGKSTLTKQLVRESETYHRIPIWIPFRQFVSSGLSILEYLDQHYVPWLGLSDLRVPDRADQTGRTRSLGQWCYDQWQSGLGVIIFDGLDEVFRHEERVAVLKALPITGTDRTRPATILTSRPLSQSLLLQMARVEIQGLTPSDQGEFIKQYRSSLQLTDKQITRFTSATQKQSRLQSLLTRPGHLIQILTTYARTNTLLDTETAVLNSVLESRLTITERIEPPVAGGNAKKKRQVLMSLALHLLACRQGRQQTRAQLLALIHQVLHEQKQVGTSMFPLSQATALLHDFVRNSGLLREVEPEVYEFETVIWLQHFTGAALANPNTVAMLNLSETQVLDFLDKKAWDPEWEPVLKSWVGNAKNPFPFFTRLMDKQKDDLAQHRLGVAGRCLSEVRPELQSQSAYQRLTERIPTESFAVWKIYAERHIAQLVTKSLGRALVETEVGQTQLLSLLQSPHRSMREAAARDLGELGMAMPNSVQGALVARLDDDDWGVREASVEAIGRLGTAMSSSVQGALVARLADDDGGVREAAVEALGGLGTAIPVFVQQARQRTLMALMADPSWAIRRHAASRIGAVMTVPMQQSLLAWLANPHDVTRCSAVGTIGRLLCTAMPVSIQQVLQQAIMTRLEDPNWIVRLTAARALSSVQQQGHRFFLRGSVVSENRLVSELSATGHFPDMCHERLVHLPTALGISVPHCLPLTAL